MNTTNKVSPELSNTIDQLVTAFIEYRAKGLWDIMMDADEYIDEVNEKADEYFCENLDQSELDELNGSDEWNSAISYIDYWATAEAAKIAETWG